VTCRAIARKRVDKHVSVEIDSWKPTSYGTYFHGYLHAIYEAVQSRTERDQNGVTPRQSFILSYCN
jgi:hypothetical protein